MQTHGNALWRWLAWHRLQLAAAAALIGVSVLLLFTAPALVAFVAIEWKYSRRPSRLLSLAIAALLVRAIVWLWQELRCVPHRPWHPCAQCGAPIEAPSRAWFCSPTCRQLAQLERDARSPDPWLSERAAVRLRVLARASAADPELSEIPF